MTIGISGDSATSSQSAPAATGDSVAPGSIPETGISLLNNGEQNFDRLREDVLMGRLNTAAEDQLGMIIALLRAQLYQMQEGLGTSSDIDDLITQGAADHPMN